MGNRTILLADDEPSFREATADLLRREGYICDEAASADAVHVALEHECYDLLIADIRMPGNAKMRVVRDAQHLVPGIPIILVTGYPSAESAIQAVELPVVAYVTKPVDFPELLRHIEAALQRDSERRSLRRALEDLYKCGDELRVALESLASPSSTVRAEAHLVNAATVRRLALCVHELMPLAVTEPLPGHAADACQTLDCPNWPAQRAVFEDAVDVLREIKKRFKSKELAALRERIEAHLGVRQQAADLRLFRQLCVQSTPAGR